jgi:hypothetical protein
MVISVVPLIFIPLCVSGIKQSWTADKGWSSSLGVGRGTNKFSP